MANIVFEFCYLLLPHFANIELYIMFYLFIAFGILDICFATMDSNINKLLQILINVF
jgi:hypothetical protein